MWAARRSSLLGALIIVCCTGTVWGQAPELKYDFKPGRHYGYDLTIVIDTEDFVETRTGYSLFRVDGAGDDRIGMLHRGELTPHRKEKPGGRRDWGPVHIIASPGFVNIDRRGKLIACQYAESLDYVLGLVQTLAIEHLPEKPQNDWVWENELKFVESHSFSGTNVGGDPLSRKRKATERSEYSIEEDSGDLIRVRKKYTMESGEGIRGMSHVDIKGGGTFLFHRREGIVSELDMKYEILTRKDGDRETVTAQVKCRRMDPSKLKRMVTDLEDQWKRNSGILFEELPKTALKPDERAQLLRDLRSSDLAKQVAAVDRLLWAPADETPEDIGDALGAIVSNSKSIGARVKAAKALKTWGSPGAVAVLTEAVDDWAYFPGAPSDSKRPLSRAAMDALAAIGTEEAVRGLCRWMKDYPNEIMPALISVGPAAEIPVAELLAEDSQASRRACTILTEIGTIRSVLPLVLESTSGQSRREAAATLEAIAKREGMSVDELVAKAEREHPETLPVTAAGTANYRVWTDASGNFTVEAQMQSFSNDMVKLRTGSGKTIDVPISRLCQADREFLKNQRTTSVEAFESRPRDTQLVGGSGGFDFRQIGRSKDQTHVMGLLCWASSWEGKPAIILRMPFFDRGRPPGGGVLMAKEGYAIGALKVAAGDLVTSLQVVYMRIKPDGRLDPADSYEGELVGDPAGKTPVVIGGTGAPVFGIYGRRGAVLDAVGLVTLGK
jgi:SLA1 homology domain 1, SHD1